MRVLGLDPSMNNWGWVLAELNGNLVTPVNAGVISIKPDLSIKSKPNQNIQRISRLMIDLEKLNGLASTAYVEVPHGGKSSQAAVSATVCQSMLGVLKYAGMDIIPVTAHANKKTVGNPKASKHDVINWIENLHPNFLPRKPNQEINLGKAEHIADALLTIYTGINK